MAWFRFSGLVFLLIVFLQQGSLAQETSNDLTQYIEKLLTHDGLVEAKQLLDQTLKRNINNSETVSQLVYWLGKIEIQENKDQSFPKAIDLADSLLGITNKPQLRYNTLLGISKLYNEKGNLDMAQKKGALALAEAKKIRKDNLLATSYYHLGEFALRSGNLTVFEENTREAFSFLKNEPSKEFSIASRILNYMGAVMYLTGKPDSALIYYQKALGKVGSMDKTTENQLYFPAAIKANMVLLLQSQNKYEEALQLAQECIVLNNKFLQNEKHPLRFRALRNLSLAYRNLASLYEQIGDYQNTHTIANLAYHHAKKYFEPHLLEYFSAVTLLAEAKIAVKDYSNAILVLQEAENSLKTMQGENPLLWANYHTIAARAYFEMGDYQKAKQFYEKGNFFHAKAQEGSISSDRFFSDMNLALCYSHLKEKEKAYELLDQHFERLATGTLNSDSRLNNTVLVTYARAALQMGDFEKVVSMTNIFIHNNPIEKNKAVNVFVPEILTLNAQAKYALNAQKSIDFLKEIDETLQRALDCVNEHKLVFAANQNTESLILQNIEVFDFAKRITLELYQKTKDDQYLEKLLNIHESSIYARIRDRLGIREYVSGFNISPQIIAREKALQNKFQNNPNSVEQFLEASSAWGNFLDSLKQVAPAYYKLRYASIDTDLTGLRNQIPKETTILRYVFIDDQLYVYVLDAEDEELVLLEKENLDQIIEVSSSFGASEAEVSFALYNLYVMLWKPIAKKVKNKNVIILPDRELFNLSFEILTPEPIESYTELATKSLLGQYNISYHYSLQLLGTKTKMLDFEEDFIAFAPEFDDTMKADYQMAISDSLFLDKTYLTLLPQPFSFELVQKFTRKFGGSSFLNGNASKQLFTKNAKEHKIIHIGTHAESNNVSPELSRLVFAKNVSDSVNINDNYLYTYEIYDQNLSSNLAILTACETGKPTYQPGEGMISLAHAFNYAGSESILTSLSKIDEKSSTQIMDSFYGYLHAGKSKDMALRLAKLDYLKTNEGRTLHPQYWAGLVLMGNTSALELSEPVHWSLWLLPVLFIIFLMMIYISAKKKPCKRG